MLTRPNDSVTTYQYDPLNRLRQMQTGAGSFTYAYTGANPLVQSLTRPNGGATEYQYDGLNRLTEIANFSGSGDLLTRYGYTYNAQDVRDNETITNGAAFAALPEGVTTYSYNTVNHLLNTTNPDQAFEYDADGNMTQGYTKDGYAFTATYDAENRLTSVTFTDDTGILHTTAYAYNGDGLMSGEKTYENGTLQQETRFVRAGLLTIQDRDENNTVVSEYTWGLNLGGGIGGLVNLRQNDQNYAYLYDGSGNVDALINSLQAVVATYRYDPFGNLLAKTGALNQPYGFSTKRSNAQTGLVYYGYRFYSSSTGRWTTRDPLGEAGGLNLYVFVGNNPVNWVDPFGLETIVIITMDYLVSNWPLYGSNWLLYGSHAAVFISNSGDGTHAIYDPAGSYGNRNTIGTGDMITGAAANLEKFVEYHLKTSEKVYQIPFNTTLAEEAAIFDKAVELGGSGGGFCAVKVSGALDGIGPFKGFKGGWIPGTLYKALQKLQKSMETSPSGK